MATHMLVCRAGAHGARLRGRQCSKDYSLSSYSESDNDSDMDASSDAADCSDGHTSELTLEPSLDAPDLCSTAESKLSQVQPQRHKRKRRSGPSLAIHRYTVKDAKVVLPCKLPFAAWLEHTSACTKAHAPDFRNVCSSLFLLRRYSGGTGVHCAGLGVILVLNMEGTPPLISSQRVLVFKA